MHAVGARPRGTLLCPADQRLKPDLKLSVEFGTHNSSSDSGSAVFVGGAGGGSFDVQQRFKIAKGLALEVSRQGGWTRMCARVGVDVHACVRARMCGAGGGSVGGGGAGGVAIMPSRPASLLVLLLLLPPLPLLLPLCRCCCMSSVLPPPTMPLPSLTALGVRQRAAAVTGGSLLPCQRTVGAGGGRPAHARSAGQRGGAHLMAAAHI